MEVQPADTGWAKCSGEVVYQGRLKVSFLQLRDLPADRFYGVQTCPGILRRLLTSWNMFHDSTGWNKGALIKNRARALQRIYQKGGIRRHEHVTTPRIMVEWQDVGMLNQTADCSREAYDKVMQNAGHHGSSGILR